MALDADQQPPDYWLQHSEIVYSASEVSAALDQMASKLDSLTSGQPCLLLCVVRGGIYVTGQLMARMVTATQLDYIQVNRYHGTLGKEIVWTKLPEVTLAGKLVILLDDILDEGVTLAALKQYCLQQGAARVLIAVLTEKANRFDKPVKADVVGLLVPDAYVFGCGMDVYGWWRNLPYIRRLKLLSSG